MRSQRFGQTKSPTKMPLRLGRRFIYSLGEKPSPRRSLGSEPKCLCSIEEDYGTKNSVRIDVFEDRRDGTVCIYDIKTGKSELSRARAAELAEKVLRAYSDAKRILVIEVRPTR